MKVIFIAGCYSVASEEKLRRLCRGKVGIQNAPNAFQWSIIKGLYECGADFETFSFPWLPIFPLRFRRPYTFTDTLMLEDTCVGKMYPYCTVIGLKPLSIRNRLKKRIENYLKTVSNDEQIVLLLYSPLSYYLRTAIDIKKKYPNIKIAVIITDLIDDAVNYKTNNTFLKRIQVREELKWQQSSYCLIDKFILLTKAMEERIPEAKGKSIIVEGICDKITPADYEKQESEIKQILYTGTLQKYVGIDDFINAFILTSNHNYRLIICGAGPSEDYINEMAKKDSRIIYKGVVPRQEALKLQQESTVVVNPRKPSEAITRYSFPSKTMEYLSSGTPMIGYKLEGIPEEYYSYFYSPVDMSDKSMALLIETVLSKPLSELVVKAQEAKSFVVNHKSPLIQVRRILEFIGK